MYGTVTYLSNLFKIQRNKAEGSLFSGPSVCLTNLFDVVICFQVVHGQCGSFHVSWVFTTPAIRCSKEYRYNLILGNTFGGMGFDESEKIGLLVLIANCNLNGTIRLVH